MLQYVCCYLLINLVNEEYGDDNDFAEYHDLQNLSSISVTKFCHIYIYILILQ